MSKLTSPDNSIKIAFLDFWDNFNPEDNFIVNTLRARYKVQVVRADSCQILFFGSFGYSNLQHLDPIRIYYTGENDIPDFNTCDYAMSFHTINFRGRHLRLPLYAWYPSFQKVRGDNRLPARAEHDGFCSFVVSNNWCADPTRTQFFEILSKYKHVASGGRFANNIGGPVADKFEFLNRYKFNIAFENSAVPGYTTEKIFDAFAAGTIPIYWGNPEINLDVNPQSYININSFKSIEEAIEHIKCVDNNQQIYNAYVQANPLLNCSCLSWEESFLDFMEDIINNPVKHMPRYGMGGRFHTDKLLVKEDLFQSNFVKHAVAFRNQAIKLKKIFKK